MPKAMTEAEINPIAEEVDELIMATGESEAAPRHKIDLAGNFGDLSNGGKVGQASVVPIGESGRVVFDKRLREPGRPTVRAVWMWNGTPSTIPLSYDPSGKSHDAGRKYLMKRHCPVCNYTGFKGSVCPDCRKNGREIAPVGPAFYLKLSQVPNQQKFFGSVDCIVHGCTRKGKYGFLDEPQMRQHAMGKHRLEYRAYQDSQQAGNEREMAEMRRQIAELTSMRLGGADDEARKERNREKMRVARAGRNKKAEVAAQPAA